MKVLYGVCSWGLGHATRSLPIIRKLIDEDANLTIISHGNALKFLKDELRGKEVRFFDIKDYPIPVSETKGAFIAKSIMYWPRFMQRMNRGIKFVARLSEKEKFDVIVSDGRYDIYSRRIPSFLITHQVRILNPFKLRLFEYGSEIFNLFFLKRFVKFIVPDYEDSDNLSGKLSHDLKLIRKDQLSYVGVLSDFRRRNLKRDIDLLISLSGPEPQRGILERIIMNQLSKIDGKIVFTLGRPDRRISKDMGNVKVYSIVDRDKREELMNRAKMVMARSGYSTIMDLAVIKTKALLIPTPGQTEQEYLAKYHMEKGNFYHVEQENLNLERDLEKAKGFTGITRDCDTEKSVEKVLEEITNPKA